MRNFTTTRVFDESNSVMAALEHEPDIRPDLSRAGLGATLTIIYCLIYKGTDSAAAIHRYLSARGNRFDREAIDFLLNAYEGDDPAHHLWSLNRAGQLVPLLGPAVAA